MEHTVLFRALLIHPWGCLCRSCGLFVKPQVHDDGRIGWQLSKQWRLWKDLCLDFLKYQEGQCPYWKSAWFCLTSLSNNGASYDRKKSVLFFFKFSLRSLRVETECFMITQAMNSIYVARAINRNYNVTVTCWNGVSSNVNKSLRSPFYFIFPGLIF